MTTNTPKWFNNVTALHWTGHIADSYLTLGKCRVSVGANVQSLSTGMLFWFSNTTVKMAILVGSDFTQGQQSIARVRGGITFAERTLPGNVNDGVNGKVWCGGNLAHWWAVEAAAAAAAAAADGGEVEVNYSKPLSGLGVWDANWNAQGSFSMHMSCALLWLFLSLDTLRVCLFIYLYLYIYF